MVEKRGIKESMELMLGASALTILIIKRLRDGFQMSDIVAIMSALAKQDEFKDAIKGVTSVPKEMADISINEIMELGAAMIKEVPKYLAAMKGR